MTKIVVYALGCLLGASVCAAQSLAPVDHEWTLGEVLTAVLAQYPLVEAARARADAARADRVTAVAFPNPVATYWSEGSSFPGGGPLTGIDHETSAYVTMPIAPFFQRSSRVRVGDQGVIEAEAAMAIARRDAALAATRAFYRVALAQAAVEAARDNHDALTPLVSFSEARVKEGAMPEVEFMRVQVELDRAAADVGLADADLARARAELRSFLQDNSGSAGPLDTPRVAVLPGPAAGSALAPLGEYLTRAATGRPELQSARARLASTEATLAYQRTLSVREIGATFGMKRTTGQNSLIAGFSMAVPLFDRNQGGVARATAEGRAARQELAASERTVSSEVQGAYAAAQRLSLQVAALRPLFLQRAEQVQRITLAAYQEGGTSLLQVLDASRTLADARLTYARTLFAERESRVDLALAAGAEPSTAAAILESATDLAPSGSSLNGGRQ